MSVNLMYRQRGLTAISWLLIIAFLMFQGMVILRVAPVYVNDHSIKQILKSMQTDTSLIGKTPKDLQEIFFKRLRVNNIFTMDKKSVKIKRSRSHYLFIVQYEPRGNIVGSLDYIVTFKHEAKIPIR